jgi:hypothetical protein
MFIYHNFSSIDCTCLRWAGVGLVNWDTIYYRYYMSLQYCNKSKSQLTSPTPAQAASCCVIRGTYSIVHTICPTNTATNPNLSWPPYTPAQLPAVAVSLGHVSMLLHSSLSSTAFSAQLTSCFRDLAHHFNQMLLRQCVLKFQCFTPFFQKIIWPVINLAICWRPTVGEAWWKRSDNAVK